MTIKLVKIIIRDFKWFVLGNDDSYFLWMVSNFSTVYQGWLLNQQSFPLFDSLQSWVFNQIFNLYLFLFVLNKAEQQNKSIGIKSESMEIETCSNSLLTLKRCSRFYWNSFASNKRWRRSLSSVSIFPSVHVDIFINTEIWD